MPGNGGVIEELYGTYGGAVYRRCLRMLGSSDEAESMVQEVFLAMLPRIEKLGEPEKAAHYLFRITTNQCLNRLRRVALRRRTELPELLNREQADDFGGMGRDPSQSVPDVLELRRCIGLVRGRMQRVVCLHFLEEMTLVEVAAELGISPQYAGRLIKRFRARVESERALLEGKT